jgi:hypothetical protein
VFTARYALSPYIKQIRFFFKGLNGSRHLKERRCLHFQGCKVHEGLLLLIASQELSFVELAKSLIAISKLRYAELINFSLLWILHTCNAYGVITRYGLGKLQRRISRSQWPRRLRRRSAAERLLLGSWVRVPPEGWMFVSCTVFVLSGRGLCDGPIPRPEESYRLRCVSECDQVKINNLDTYCG